MTEDDTFNKLRRLPFKEVKTLWQREWRNTDDNGYQLVVSCGWNPDEFIDTWHGPPLERIKRSVFRQIINRFKK